MIVEKTYNPYTPVDVFLPREGGEEWCETVAKRLGYERVYAISISNLVDISDGELVNDFSTMYVKDNKLYVFIRWLNDSSGIILREVGNVFEPEFDAVSAWDAINGVTG